MDVGTGRQSLALAQLGALEVAHFDIFGRTWKFQRFLSEKGLNIKSLADICEHKLSEHADFNLFICRVLSNTSDPKKAIKNLSKSCAPQKGMVLSLSSWSGVSPI